jgi:hypothetical protein
MRSADLTPGGTYFVLSYEDDDLSRPIVNSYEYLGRNVHGTPDGTEDSLHFFRVLGSDDELELAESQLDLALDLSGLIEALEEFRLGKHKVLP